MAVTQIHPIKVTPQKAIDYIINPEKTDGKNLVSSFGVCPETGGIEFEMTRDLSKQIRGKERKNCNLAYHVIQSFEHGEATPEQALEIMQRLATDILKEQYEYVLSTHTDKQHIHNHLIFNATSFETLGKYNDDMKGYWQIRNRSDDLCREYGLSVIEKPKSKGKTYTEYMADKQGASWKSQIKEAMDKNILVAKDYPDFINLMQQDNFEYKDGKHIAFKTPGQERFTRTKKLGEAYTKENIIIAINKLRNIGKENSTHIDHKEEKSWRLQIKNAIDKNVLLAKNYSDFISLMQQDNFEYKDGKHIAFKAPRQERFIRTKSLGESYTKENIEDRIMQPNKKFSKVAENIYQGDINQIRHKPNLDLLFLSVLKLDKKQNIKRSYFKKSQAANIQDISDLLLYMRDNKINCKSDLLVQQDTLIAKCNALRKDLHKVDVEKQECQEIIKQLQIYTKYIDINREYETALFKKSFKAKHSAELQLFKVAAEKLQNKNLNPQNLSLENYTQNYQNLQKKFDLLTLSRASHEKELAKIEQINKIVRSRIREPKHKNQEKAIDK